MKADMKGSGTLSYMVELMKFIINSVKLINSVYYIKHETEKGTY